MKQYNRDEYNLMCAKFLGWKTYDDIFYRIPAHLQDHSGIKQDIVLDGLIFDTDWNWIHGVIEKIENTKRSNFSPNTFPVVRIVGMTCEICFYGNYKQTIVDIIRPTKKEAVIESIWVFLNWYYGKINN